MNLPLRSAVLVFMGSACLAQAPLFQPNSPISALDVDGVQGTTSAAARVVLYANTVHTFHLGSTLGGAPFALAMTGEGVYASNVLPGFATANGQAVNVNLGAPTLVWPVVGPHPGSAAVPFTVPFTLAPVTLSTQQVVATVSHPDGFVLSAPTEIVLAPNLVELANAYLATLTTTQRAATLVAHTQASAAKWSNLPASPSSGGTTNLRNGVSYSTLTATQQAAWRNLVVAALGTSGYAEFQRIQASDNYLGTLNGGYNGNYQYVAFAGTPSTSSGWLMQVGGHHVAWNLYFSGLDRKSTTPHFLGVEPQSFTYGGVSYTPLKAQRDGMYALVNSLTATQLPLAKLTTSFSDVYLGPGKDARTNFPTGTTNRGLLAANLTPVQQDLVKAAIAAWVSASPESSTYQPLYESELGQTYVAYSGTTTFQSQGDYVRIDGPHVWIEFACQGGIVVPGQIHFHTIWRDRVTDYNAAFGF